MTKNVFAYVRVSTLKQGEGVSLQEQRRAIEEYARRSGLSIAAWFEEMETAAKRGRRAFGEMLSLLRRGKASGIVLHKIDRGARNLKDWADLGELIDQGIAVHLAGDNLDLGSRGGRLSADIQAVVASDYIRNLREETKKGINGRLRQGLLPNTAPLGYLDRGGGKPKEIDPVRGPLIREAFDLYASGRYSLRTLREELHRRGLRTKGGRPVALSTISLALNNPFHMGLIEVKSTGEVFPGVHKPIITKELFEAVQSRLRGKAQVKVRRHGLLFRRLFRCEACQNLLVGEVQKGHTYYRCHTGHCPLRCIREEALDLVVREKLGLLHFSSDERMLLDCEMRKLESDSTTLIVEGLKTVRLQLSQVSERLARLTDALLDGILDREIFDERKRALLMERRGIEDKIEDLESGKRVGQLEELLELAHTALLGYESASADDRRHLVETLFSNRELRSNGPYVELSLPFRLIAERHSVHDGCPSRDTNRSLSNVPDRLPIHLETLVKRLREALGSDLFSLQGNKETQT